MKSHYISDGNKNIKLDPMELEFLVKTKHTTPRPSPDYDILDIQAF